MTRRLLAVLPAALLLLGALPVDGQAQVFIASHPNPDFKIGPLFVSAAVSRRSISGDPGPLTVTVSWSLVLPPDLTGPMFAALARRAARTFRARVHVGRGQEQRERGAILSRDTLERIRPGETSYEEVRRLCGPNAEEQQHLASGETRALVYRGERLVPHRSRSFGWFATISHWDVEHHETQIDFEGDRVRDIQARIRRTRLAQPLTG